MRLLLDPHVSGPKIAAALRGKGHDVFAVDEHRDLEGISDEEVFQMAAEQGRTVITFNARDYHRLAVEFAGAGRSHSGCMIVVGIDHAEFGLIIRRILEQLDERPRSSLWSDYTSFITRADN